MKTNNMIIKKTIYILAVFLGLQFNTVFAAGNVSGETVSSKEVILGMSPTMLAPATPLEATFEDAVEINSTAVNLSDLIPCIPRIADFNDGAPSTEMSRINLAPVTPKEADFEDENDTNNESSVQDLVPVTPAGADFEDHV